MEHSGYLILDEFDKHYGKTRTGNNNLLRRDLENLMGGISSLKKDALKKVERRISNEICGNKTLEDFSEGIKELSKTLDIYYTSASELSESLENEDNVSTMPMLSQFKDYVVYFNLIGDLSCVGGIVEHGTHVHIDSKDKKTRLKWDYNSREFEIVRGELPKVVQKYIKKNGDAISELAEGGFDSEAIKEFRKSTSK